MTDIPAMNASDAIRIGPGLHGHQAVAAQDLAVGTQIQERALATVHYTTHYNANKDLLFSMDEDKMWTTLYSIKDFLDGFPDDGLDENKGVKDVMLWKWKNNAINTGNSGGRSGSENLYTHFCKVDHACRPNCVLHIDRRSKKATVIVVKDILAGEPLTFNYLFFEDKSRGYKSFLAMSRNDRIKAVRAVFPFDCRCGWCEEDSQTDAAGGLAVGNTDTNSC